LNPNKKYKKLPSTKISFLAAARQLKIKDHYAVFRWILNGENFHISSSKSVVMEERTTVGIRARIYTSLVTTISFRHKEEEL
jgi:hypothetical protein